MGSSGLLSGRAGWLVATLALVTASAFLVQSWSCAAASDSRPDEFPFEVELPPKPESPGYPALSDGFVDSGERCARLVGCLENVYRVIEARLTERLAREFPHCWRTWSYQQTTATPYGIVMKVTVRCLEYGKDPI